MPEGIGEEGLPSGIPEGSPEASDGANEAVAELLDVDQYGDRMVTIKVDGQESQVKVSEAIAGYQRQSDYTQKTQAHASDVQFASAIKAALQSDPKGTLELLARTHGVQFGSTAPSEEEHPAWDSEGPSDDKYSQLDARLRAFEDTQASQRLDGELSRLAVKYGEEFNPQEVVTAAMASGSTDLEGVFKTIAFDRIYGRTAAATAAAVATAAATQAATDAKRDASFVAGGSSAANRQAVEDGPINSIRDAFDAAKRDLGG